MLLTVDPPTSGLDSQYPPFLNAASTGVLTMLGIYQEAIMCFLSVEFKFGLRASAPLQNDIAVCCVEGFGHDFRDGC